MHSQPFNISKETFTEYSLTATDASASTLCSKAASEELVAGPFHQDAQWRFRLFQSKEIGLRSRPWSRSKELKSKTNLRPPPGLPNRARRV